MSRELEFLVDGSKDEVISSAIDNLDQGFKAAKERAMFLAKQLETLNKESDELRTTEWNRIENRLVELKLIPTTAEFKTDTKGLEYNKQKQIFVVHKEECDNPLHKILREITGRNLT